MHSSAQGQSKNRYLNAPAICLQGRQAGDVVLCASCLILLIRAHKPLARDDLITSFYRLDYGQTRHFPLFNPENYPSVDGSPYTSFSLMRPLEPPELSILAQSARTPPILILTRDYKSGAVFTHYEDRAIDSSDES